MAVIHAFAKWCEKEGVDWWSFPAREADRCLMRYRGTLVRAIKAGEIKPSVGAKRMSGVVRFYRWMAASGLISTDWPMWGDKQVGIRITDSFGFERTIQRATTNLSIPNRSRMGLRLEDGLIPVSVEERNAILAFAQKHASDELSWMLRLGFRTGMRVGTITSLRIGTLNRAVPDPLMRGWYRLSVGPGAHPSVATKFGVTGQIWIEGGDLRELKQYIYSTRRLQRQVLAATHDRDVVFLTRFGKPYSDQISDTSRAVNVEMGRLRKLGVASGLSALHGFHFHQSRVTFATELARLVMKHGTVSLAIQMVKEALLHADEKTTLLYIRFIEKNKIMSKSADDFTQAFLGLMAENTPA